MCPFRSLHFGNTAGCPKNDSPERKLRKNKVKNLLYIIYRMFWSWLMSLMQSLKISIFEGTGWGLQALRSPICLLDKVSGSGRFDQSNFCRFEMDPALRSNWATSLALIDVQKVYEFCLNKLFALINYIQCWNSGQSIMLIPSSFTWRPHCSDPRLEISSRAILATTRSGQTHTTRQRRQWRLDFDADVHSHLSCEKHIFPCGKVTLLNFAITPTGLEVSAHVVLIFEFELGTSPGSNAWHCCGKGETWPRRAEEPAGEIFF